MIVTILVSVAIDAAALEREAARHGLSLDVARSALLADLENRLDGAVKWREGVSSVGVQVFSAAIGGAK